MSGVYSLNDPGYSLRHPSAPKTFLPDVDGNFPSGIPGNTGTPYIRPAGIWTGEKDWDEVITANFGHDQQGTDGNSTAGLISETGVVYTALPPNSRSYILGPLVDGFVYNHGHDAYTRIGYIQKDTRQFVLLAIIRGTWKTNFPQESGASTSNVNFPVWDGTTVDPSSGFHSYGSMTLADAQWMRSEIIAGRYMKNTAYRSSGGIGQILGGLGGLLDGLGSFYQGAGVGGGSGDAAVAGSGGGGGYGQGGDPTIGDQQTDPPKKGDAEDAGFPWFPFGKLGKKAKELWDNITDGLGDIKDNMEEFFNDAFDDAVEGAKDFRDSLQNALNNYQSSNQNQPSKDQSQKSNPIKDLGNQVKDWGNKFKNWKGIDGEGLTMGEKGQFAQEVLTTAFRLAAAVPAGNKAMQTFRDTNDPNSKDFGKHTPGHKNYEGPKEVEMSAGERTHISNQINQGLSELGIDTSTDRNLTAAEIKKISDYMAKGEAGVAGQFKGPDKSMPFYVTFWSLPPNVTTVSIKDGKVSKVNSNYLFTDETDVSIGKAITQIPMNNTANNLAKYYEKNPDEKLVGGAYQSHTYTKEPFQKHHVQSDILVSVDGGKTYGLLSGYSVEQIQASKNKGGIKTKPNPNAGKVDPNKNKVIGILNPMEIEMNFDTSKSKQKSTNKGQNLNFTTMGYTPDGDVLSERSNGLRRVKFVMEDVAAAPAPTTPTNQTTTQQPTESKQTADALAKDYVEKNGPEKTQELIDKTDEYLSAHGQDPKHHSVDDSGDIAGVYGDAGMIDIDGRGWFVTPSQLQKMHRNPGNYNLRPRDIRLIDGWIRNLQVMNDPQYKDPNSNVAKNVPSWFWYSGYGPAVWSMYEGKPVIWGYNYSGGYGYITPGPGSGDPGTPESGYGTPGFDWDSQSGGTSWTFVLHTPKAKPETSPFPKEPEVALGAKPGDDIAWGKPKEPPNPENKQPRGMHFNIINYYNSGMCCFPIPDGWTDDDVRRYVENDSKGFPSSSKKSGNSIASTTGASATDAAILAGKRKKKTMTASYKPKGRRLQESDLNLSRRKVRLLKEIKKPVLVEELPQQKLKKYRPNFKGKFSPQNTPDKTASKESDALVMSGNQKGQAWRTQDKYWSGYETQERMNVIVDRVGHGDLAWQMIVDEAREKNGWKNREVQEHLNIIAAEKGMREQVPDYESPFGYVIHEQGASTEEELDTVMKDPLVKKVAKRLRTQIDYKDKPSRKGFPDEPPAKQQDGWHPEYGKKYKYDKLDPQSAEAMPPTGNPEIDANVEKAKPKKPKWKHINTESKVDPKVKWEESVDWREELKEVTKDT